MEEKIHISISNRELIDLIHYIRSVPRWDFDAEELARTVIKGFRQQDSSHRKDNDNG